MKSLPGNPYDGHTLATVIPSPPAAGADPDDLLVDGVVAFLRAVAGNPTPWRLILTPVEGTPQPPGTKVTRCDMASATCALI